MSVAYPSDACHAAPGAVSVLRSLIAILLLHLGQTFEPPEEEQYGVPDADLGVKKDVSSLRNNLDLIGSDALNLNTSCDPAVFDYDWHEPRSLYIRLGISANFDDITKSYELRGLLLGLKLWQMIISQDEELVFGLRFCIYNDQGDLETAKEIYSEFATRKHPSDETKPYYTMLLGPQNRSFNYEIAKVTQSTKIPIVFWAIEDGFQTAWKPQLFAELDRGGPDSWSISPPITYARASQDAESTIGPWTLEHSQQAAERDITASRSISRGGRLLQETSELSQDAWDFRYSSAKVPERPSRRATTIGNDPDGPMWDQGYTNVFDITVQKSSATYVLVAYLRERFRFRSIIIVGLDPTAACVKQVSEDAVRAGYTSIDRVHFGSSHAIPQMIFDGGWSISGTQSVWYLCGNKESTSIAMTSFRAMHFTPPVLVLDSVEILEEMIQVLPHYMMNYVFAPKKYAFGSPGSFITVYPTVGCAEMGAFTFPELNRRMRGGGNLGGNLELFENEYPTVETVQVSGAMAVIFQAACKLKLYDKLHRRFRKHLGEADVETWAGTVSFDSKGKCKTCEGGAFQLLPLTQRVTAGGVGINHDYRLVYPNTSTHILIPPMFRKAYAHMVVPSPTWQQKELDTYFCDPGCVITYRSSGLECVACPRGKYRSPTDLECLECIEFGQSLYADELGLSRCKVCPEGTTCDRNKPWQVPTPNREYFKIRLFPGKAEDICAENYEPPEAYSFVHCLAPRMCLGGDNVCQGSNFGMSCAQCHKGHTFQGMNPNSRECAKCPDSWVLIMRLVLTVCVFFLLLYLFQAAVVFAAKDTSNLLVPIMLSLLGHFQMLGLVFYIGRVEVKAGNDFGLYSIPYLAGLFLTQPIHLIQAECLWINAFHDGRHMSSEEAIEAMEAVRGVFAVGIALGLLGYGVALVQFLLRLLWRILMFRARVARHRFQLPEIAFTGQQLSSRNAHAGEIILRAQIDSRNSQRLCLMWSILSYPILLTSTFMPVSCIENDLDKPRLYNDLNIVCNEGPHEEFTPVAVTFGVLFFLLTPLLMCSCYWYIYSTIGYWNYRVIFTSGFLLSGYQLPYFHFGVWSILRMGFVEVALCFYNINLRIAVMVAIQFLYIVLYERNLPRASNDRFALGSIDKFSNYSLFFSSLACFLLVPGTPPHDLLEGTKYLSWILDDAEFVIMGVAIVNILFVVFALYCILYNRFLLPLHVYKKTGGTLNCFQKCVARFSLLFHGFHAIRVSSGHRDDLQVDLGRIEQKERSFLLRTLQETLQVCMQSVRILDISMVIAAMNENFIRAGQARDIRVMQDESGASSVMDRAKIGVVKSFPVSMGQSKSTQSGSTAAPKKSASTPKSAGSRFFDMEEQGITVDELYSAFLHVAVDVITHEPAIHSLNCVEDELENGHKSLKGRVQKLPQEEEDNYEFRVRGEKKEDKIVTRLDQLFLRFDRRRPVSWGLLQEMCSDPAFCEQLEVAGLSDEELAKMKELELKDLDPEEGPLDYNKPYQKADFEELALLKAKKEEAGVSVYDLQRAFASIAGEDFQKPDRAGATGVNNTFVEYWALIREIARRFDLQNQKLEEMRQVKQRGKTFDQGAVVLERYFDEEEKALAQNKAKAMQVRCEEALAELTALREELKRRQTKYVRAAHVKNHMVSNAQNPDLDRLFAGRDNPAIMDAHTLLTKWAQDENMLEEMPEPESIVSPRMRGIDWPKYAKWNTHALEHYLKDEKAAEHEIKREAEKPGLEYEELDLSRGGAVERQGGAVGVAAAIMARAICIHDRPGSFTKPRPAPQQTVVPQPFRPEDLEQDALEFCFNASAKKKVHHEVFKAMLLSQLRGMAVPQKAVMSLQLDFRDNTDQLILDVTGPVFAVAELRKRNLTNLRVMGHPLRYIQEPPERQRVQPSASHALEDSQTQLVAASAGSNDAMERSHLVWALSELRLVAAARHAERLKARGKDASLLVGEQAFGRISQIHACWNECLECLSKTYEIKEEWIKESVPELKMEYGCQMGGYGYLESVLTAELEDCDPFRAFSALQELNAKGAVQGPLLGPLDSASELRKHGEDKVVGESVWRTLSESKELNMKEDNVWQISMVDALEEPLACIWVCARSTAEARTQLHPDLELPRVVDAERTRGAHKVFFCIKPYKKPQVGFRLMVVSRVQLTPAQYSVFWMMPSWGLARTVKPLMVDFTTRFRELASSKDELPSGKDKTKFSHYEKMIGIVKQHLDGVNDKL